MYRQSLLVVLVVCFALSGSQNVLAAKKVAFLVGVNKYKKPGFRNLNYAENDVTAMSKELKKFGFEVTIVTGKNATKSNLETTVQKLVAPLSKEDLVLVMLAGHGVQVKGGDAYYCPYDAIIDNNETLFSISSLLNKTLAPNVGTKLVLLDACRNDPDPGRGRSVGIQGKVIALPEDTVVMFSCRSGQQSFENDNIKHGLFTYCLLDALRGGASRDGLVSWSGIQYHVLRKMASSEMNTFLPKGRKQTPIPAGGVPFTILARVEMTKPKVVAKPSLLVAPFTKKQADAKQAEWATYLNKKSSITNSVSMKFNLIPPGEFKMGRTKSTEELAKFFETKAEYFEDEYPHEVRLTKPYYIGTTEVTQKQWKSVMGTEPWKGKDFVKEGDDYAATYVSWEDAQKFIEKLNRKEGAKYRLPTEAEWEYACRAGSESMYCFGDSEETLKSYAWFNKNAWDVNEKYAHRVGLKSPNNFGLFDVHGNVWEWCSDWYGKGYYKTSPLTDPSGAGAESDDRVLRGGSWYDFSRYSRSSERGRNSPTNQINSFGFRLSRTP